MLAEVVSALCFFFFKQKTAYEMRISDWSSDVCSSDLTGKRDHHRHRGERDTRRAGEAMLATTPMQFDYVGTGGLPGIGYGNPFSDEIGRASCSERVCQYV